MPQTVTGDKLTAEMENEVDDFFDDFNALCRKYGVWLRTRQLLNGEQATAQTVWRWHPTDTRPAFEIVHS
jgi:hypothetical protein